MYKILSIESFQEFLMRLKKDIEFQSFKKYALDFHTEIPGMADNRKVYVTVFNINVILLSQSFIPVFELLYCTNSNIGKRTICI